MGNTLAAQHSRQGNLEQGLQALRINNGSANRQFDNLAILKSPQGIELRFRDYVAVKKLGEGAYGVVYQVKSRSSNKHFALKALKAEHADSARTEVEVMRRLNHPNIVKLIEAFEIPEQRLYCVVMELCNGSSLDDFLKTIKQNDQTLPLEVVLPWFIQLLDALKTCHAGGFVHRDLKPANIFLHLEDGSEGTIRTIKIGDFGIASNQTRDISDPIGTPFYMAPEIFEQFNNPQAVYDSRADVWSMGLVFMQVLLGLDTESFARLFILQGDSPTIPALIVHSGASAFLDKVITGIITEPATQEITRRMISAMENRPSSEELARHATMVIWKVLVGQTIETRMLIGALSVDSAAQALISGFDMKSLKTVAVSVNLLGILLKLSVNENLLRNWIIKFKIHKKFVRAIRRLLEHEDFKQQASLFKSAVEVLKRACRVIVEVDESVWRTYQQEMRVSGIVGAIEKMMSLRLVSDKDLFELAQVISYKDATFHQLFWNSSPFKRALKNEFLNSQSEVTDCLYGTLVPHSATNAQQLLKALRRIPKHRTESRVYFLQNVPQRFRAEIAPEAVQALVEVIVQRYFLNQAHMCKTALYTLHFYLTDKYTGLCKVSEARLCATLITGHNQYYGSDLFFCKTCSIDDAAQGIVCATCAYQCHKGHDLVYKEDSHSYCHCPSIKTDGHKCRCFTTTPKYDVPLAPIAEFRPVQNLAVDKLTVNDSCQIVRDTYARYIIPGDDVNNTTCFSTIPLVTITKHVHPLRHMPQSPYGSGGFICDLCGATSNGPVYHCDACGFYDNCQKCYRQHQENKSVPAERVAAYYETTIVCGGWNKLIGVGFANKKITNDLLGHYSGSICYFGDDGKVFYRKGGDVNNRFYGPEFGSSDIVGCGVTNHGHVFFTKNGHLLEFVKDYPLFGPIYAAVSMRSPMGIVQFNFGPTFEISKVIANREPVGSIPVIASGHQKLVSLPKVSLDTLIAICNRFGTVDTMQTCCRLIATVVIKASSTIQNQRIEVQGIKYEQLRGMNDELIYAEACRLQENHESAELARHYFEFAANRGHIPSCFLFGFMLLHGDGGDEDWTRGRQFIQKAAFASHVPALVFYAHTLEYAMGGPIDREAAYSLYKEAFIKLKEMVGQTRDPWVFFTLAKLFHEGHGTKVDLVQAATFYGRAAQLGLIEANVAVVDIVANEDAIAALTMLQQAANRGHQRAKGQIGKIANRIEDFSSSGTN